MKCVDGHAELVPFATQDFRLDMCPECKGLWFDHSELELCIKKSKEEILEAFGSPAEGFPAEGVMGPERRCLVCDQVMDKERFMGGVWIDRCPRRHGIWLDASEMGAVHQQALSSNGYQPTSPSAPESVVSRLAALFRPLMK